MMAMAAVCGLAVCGLAVMAAVELPCEVSWVGNEWGGNKAWVQQDVDDLFVTADGELFTNVGWEEGGGNVMRFDRDGNWLGAAMHTHGWGYGGGEAVTANGRYVFIAQEVENERGGLNDAETWPPKGFRWAGVSRRDKAGFRKGAPFAGGKGGKGDTLAGCFKAMAAFEDGAVGKRIRIRGLAATEEELFVALREEGVIRVYDVERMEEKRSWKVSRPDRMALDERGFLWVLQAPEEESGGWMLAGFDREGQLRCQDELAAAVRPADLALDARGRLLVSDEGVSQQVLIFDGIETLSPRLCGTFGEWQGIFGGSVAGRVGERRFNRPRGVGADAAGNMYVASGGGTGGGGTVLEAYGADGKLRWRRCGLFFVDLADIDMGTEADIYSKEERFAVDWSRGVGKEAQYVAYTVNPWKYPDDPRLHIWSANARLARLNGRRVLFVSNMGQDVVQAYRFSPASDGETAVPAALFAKRPLKKSKDGWPRWQPAEGAWCWTDLNGDGAMQEDEFETLGAAGRGCVTVDEKGMIWRVETDAARGVAFAGFTEHGVPRWAWDRPVTVARPPELTALRRFKVDAERDIAMFGGTLGDDKNQHWKPMGPAVAVYQGVLAGKPERLWSAVLPYGKGSKGHESAEPMSAEIAGDYLFVCYTRGLAAEGIKWAFVKVLGLRDGKEVGNLVPERVTGELGLLDLEDGARVRQLQDGSYLVFLEDDYKAKSVMMRWRPRTEK